LQARFLYIDHITPRPRPAIESRCAARICLLFV
jgi:hypothetical protein